MHDLDKPNQTRHVECSCGMCKKYQAIDYVDVVHFSFHILNGKLLPTCVVYFLVRWGRFPKSDGHISHLLLHNRPVPSPVGVAS